MTAVSASHPIEVPVPSNELLDSVLDRGARREIHVARKIVDIRIGGNYVAWLHGQELLGRFAAEAALENLDQMQKLDRLVVTEIVQSIGGGTSCRIWTITVPGRVGYRDAIKTRDRFNTPP